METTASGKRTWETTSTANLLRHRGGTYYFRVQIASKRKLLSLRTKKLTVAQLRATAEQAKAIQARESGQRAEAGIAVVGDLIRIYQERYGANPDLGAAAKKSRDEQVARIKRTWPGIESLRPARIAFPDIVAWSHRLRTSASTAPTPFNRKRRKGYSAESVNKTLEALKRILQIAVEKGLLAVNPFEKGSGEESPRMRVEQKKIELPDAATMEQVFRAVGSPPEHALLDPRYAPGLVSNAKDAEEFVRGLAYSGMRLAEAAAFVWEDVGDGAIRVRGTKSASSRDRDVPIVPAFAKLLAAMRKRRTENKWELAGPVFRVKEAQRSLDRACKTAGVKRLTHHDLRHLFATTCVESGVDIPTVSRWLGHSDGGVLAMKTYGHLRDEHSKSAAKKVDFGGGA